MMFRRRSGEAAVGGASEKRKATSSKARVPKTYIQRGLALCRQEPVKRMQAMDALALRQMQGHAGVVLAIHAGNGRQWLLHLQNDVAWRQLSRCGEGT